MYMTILDYLRQPWNIMRVLRLVLGSYIVFTSLSDGQYIFSAVGAFFVYQAVVNAGCAACIPSDTGEVGVVENSKTDIDYEEL
ncbi:MAG: hypothetical protein ACI9DJ_000734 [Algoriphagus sp.]|jgi:hypothetical protein